MNFTDSEFDAFERDLKRATAELCEKYKIKLKGSKITYGPVEFDMKLTFQKNEDGLNAEEVNFSMECYRYGFKPSDYMRSFEHLGAEYEFIGFDTSAKKYNCLVRDLRTGATSKVNHKMLAEILKRDDERATAAHEKVEYVELPIISKEEMSLLNIKLGKSKRNEKDWDQIKQIFIGKEIFTFKVNKPNAFVGDNHNIAEEDEMLSVFTSVEACTKHLDELSASGIISGKINVTGVAFNDVIAIADQEKIDVIFDNSNDMNKGYYFYSSAEHQMKVVIKTEM